MSGESELPSVYTLIPSREPIELVSYHPQLSGYYGECELQTKRWLAENAGEDWQFLDIGAGVGFYSILMSQLAARGRIHAVEPTGTIDMLRANLKHHGVDNVAVHQLAVGARTGRLAEPIFLSGHGEPERVERDFSSIDDLASRLQLQQLDCIRIDAGGFDLEALQGAVEVVARFNPWIIVKLNEQHLARRGQTAAQSLAWLAAHGYRKALVLDDDNYVLRRSQDAGQASAIVLSTDAEPVMLPSKFTTGDLIDGFFEQLPIASNLGVVYATDHNGLRVTPGKLRLGRPIDGFFETPEATNQGAVQLLANDEGIARINVPGPQWSYAAFFGRRPDTPNDGAVAARLRLKVDGAPVGIGFLAEGASTFVGNEVAVAPTSKPQIVTLEAEDGGSVRWLVMRSVAEGGQPAQVTLDGLTVHHAYPPPGADRRDAASPAGSADRPEELTINIEAPGPQWSFAALFKRQIADEAHDGPLVASLTLRVQGGAIGVGFLREDQATFAGREVKVEPSGQFQTITIEAEHCNDVRWLVIRNADAEGLPATVALRRLTAHKARPAAAVLSPLLDRRRTMLSVAECNRALAAVGAEIATDHPSSIDIVSVARIGSALNFEQPYLPAERIQRNALAYFDTARDETAIYKYLYANMRPRRHLEFGTWEGHGVVVCASSCDAEIWTVNLPDGEVDDHGKPLYAQDETVSDAGSSIGWRYREAGFSDRVHQILCDSRELDTRQFSKGFFDTILIDGGHTREVVASDTRKSLELLRPGGLLIWHDFCPDVEVLRLQEAPRGVVAAMVENLAAWRPYLSKIFWIRPSWMLVGVRSDLQ